MLGQLEIGDWQIAQSVLESIEIVAIAVFAAGVLAAGAAAVRTVALQSPDSGVVVFKRRIASGLLLGLDLLIAADVIRTVTLEPTLDNVAALGLLVFVRTFLSWSLVLETEGRWPWQRMGATSD